MSRTKGRAFWERLVTQVEAGHSQTEVGRQHGVGASSVGYWVRKLQRERRAEARITAPLLLPVRLAETATRRVEIAVGAFRLSFDDSTEPAYVAAVARALTGC